MFRSARVVPDTGVSRRDVARKTLVPDLAELTPFCATAETFWRHNALPAGEQVILVEAMSQDLRVTLRNLTLAGALRRIFPARIVVVTGADEDWLRILWTTFDADVLRQLCTAYGAVDVVDIHALVDSLISTTPPETFTVADETFTSADLSTGIAPADLDELVHATAARVYQAPRIPQEERGSERYAHIAARSQSFSQVYDALFERFDVAALVTSHVDYNQWGLAVESAQRFDVPIAFVQSTGTFKAYCLFPETRGTDHTRTFRAELTTQIGEVFRREIWPRREQLRPAAELTTWRNKGNLGRPSWWRGKGDISALELATPAERESVRTHTMRRFGFDPAKPVVAVYNHAVSDALGTNVEIFDDLAQWFEETAAHAATRNDVNWLFIDHPSQDKYDATHFFAGLADAYAASPHLAFVPSWDLTKNAMWSLVDLGVTVRGSVSAELPAFGIPCIQAGWSEWSDLGISIVADDRDAYWSALADSIAALKEGRSLITAEQLEAARLWMWFYRSATDVPSVLVQQWELGEGDALLHALRMSMQYVETDADPVFESVHRMWTRREPFLTRFDLTRLDSTTLLPALPNATPSAIRSDKGAAAPAFDTAYDAVIPALLVTDTLTRGDHPALMLVDGVARGAAVLGRFTRSPGLIGLKVSPAQDTVRVTVSLVVDDTSATWWESRVPADVTPRSTSAPRLVVVRSQGVTRAVTLFEPSAAGPRDIVFEVRAADLDGDGLLTIELDGLSTAAPDSAREGLLAHPAVGVIVRSVGLSAAGEASALALVTSGAGDLVVVPMDAPDDVHVPLYGGLTGSRLGGGSRSRWTGARRPGAGPGKVCAVGVDTGAVYDVETATKGPDLVVTLPAGRTEPVLLRAAPTD